MNYLEYTFKNPSSKEKDEIFIAFLDNLGYSGFVESEEGFITYLPENDRNEDVLNDLISTVYPDDTSIKYTSKFVPEINWNEKWESDFLPVEVGSEVRVHASFHKKNPAFTFNIVINPKMSFGTGHHQTTQLMIKVMLDCELKDKQVLDMGTGTGVLAILASKMGASAVTAIDVDKWAYENAMENVRENQCENIKVLQGDIHYIKDMKFDLLLANINRNVLLQDMHVYSKALRDNGVIILSGLLQQDVKIVTEKAKENGLNPAGIYSKDNWIGLRFSQ